MNIKINSKSMIKTKGISSWVFIFLSVILLILVSAYFMGTTKESFLSRLGIIPEKFYPQAESIECKTDEDCPEQEECRGNLHYSRVGRCESNNRCSYGNWTFSGCKESMEYCVADCATNADCPRGFCVEDCECKR